MVLPSYLYENSYTSYDHYTHGALSVNSPLYRYFYCLSIRPHKYRSLLGDAAIYCLWFDVENV
jgi:hypothetical protein